MSHVLTALSFTQRSSVRWSEAADTLDNINNVQIRRHQKERRKEK